MIKHFKYSSSQIENQNTIPIIFINSITNEIKTIQAQKGLTLLVAAQQHGIEIEGACEGSLACSTCHVIFEKDIYDSLEKPTEAEEDMLDLAFGLTDTSRLSCQIIVDEKLKNAKIKLPFATRNLNFAKK